MSAFIEVRVGEGLVRMMNVKCIEGIWEDDCGAQIETKTEVFTVLESYDQIKEMIAAVCTVVQREKEGAK